MFRKLKLIRTLLVIGAGIALAVTYYRKRDLIRGFFRELFAPAAEPDFEAEIIEFNPPASAPEHDIVIDRTDAPAEAPAYQVSEG